MGKRAWEIREDVDDDGGVVPAYDQVVDLVGSLLDTLRVVGGQLHIASLREDTGTSIGGVKVFETVGFVVNYTDRVPGIAPAPAAEGHDDLPEDGDDEPAAEPVEVA